MFGIEESNIDLTYARKTSGSPILQYLSKYNKINFKKMNIIVGANASGKTSIGKSMCFIQNYLLGKTISMNSFLKNTQYNKDKKYGFDIEFIIEDTIFSSKVLFEGQNLYSEYWKWVPITQHDSILMLRNKLAAEPYIYSYNTPLQTNEDVVNYQSFIFDLKSAFLSSTSNQKYVEMVISNQFFSYRYSKEEYLYPVSDIDLNFFTSIMKAFDPLIKEVVKSLDNEKELIIVMSNGVKQRVKEDGTLEENSILSAGTREAVLLVEVLYLIKNYDQGIFFIDEQLAYSHSDLEKSVIELILQWIDKKDVQVFFTTHNKEILDIGLPPYNYLFTRKYNENSSIEVIHPEFEVIHKNRSLKGVVNEDIFAISPNLSSLLEIL